MKISNIFSKETFQVYPTLTNFTQRKRKTIDTNDLSALSLVSLVVYNCSLETNFHRSHI